MLCLEHVTMSHLRCEQAICHGYEAVTSFFLCLNVETFVVLMIFHIHLKPVRNAKNIAARSQLMKVFTECTHQRQFSYLVLSENNNIGYLSREKRK